MVTRHPPYFHRPKYFPWSSGESHKTLWVLKSQYGGCRGQPGGRSSQAKRAVKSHANQKWITGAAGAWYIMKVLFFLIFLFSVWIKQLSQIVIPHSSTVTDLRLNIWHFTSLNFTLKANTAVEFVLFLTTDFYR